MIFNNTKLKIKLISNNKLTKASQEANKVMDQITSQLRDRSKGKA